VSSRRVLRAVATRAQAPAAPTWDELEFVLRVVGHGYARWAVRDPVVARPVSEVVTKVRALRGGR
jgi:hypothetical protein